MLLGGVLAGFGPPEPPVAPTEAVGPSLGAVDPTHPAPGRHPLPPYTEIKANFGEECVFYDWFLLNF